MISEKEFLTSIAEIILSMFDNQQITLLVIILIMRYHRMGSIKESPSTNFRQMILQKLLRLHDGLNMTAMSLIALRLLPATPCVDTFTVITVYDCELLSEM